MSDMTGRVFTRLKVIGPGPQNNKGRAQWWCECQCENHTRLLVAEQHLLSGNTRSCGCLQRESVVKRCTTHGLRHHPLYGVHKMMKKRGIPVYEKWLGDDGIKNFVEFAETNGYKKGMRMYRKNQNKGFYPDNVEFRVVKNPRPEIIPRQMNNNDMIGKTFGHLTVIAYAGSRQRRDGEKYREWLCECDCPEHNRIVVKTDMLTSGKTEDCGCMRKRRLITKEYDLHTTEGILKNCIDFTSLPTPIQYDAYKRIGEILRKMTERCYDENSHAYERYGGRGIKICKEWRDKNTGLGNFMVWSLQNGYQNDLTIDRIDVNKDYSPKNCRWATYEEQENNKRNNTLIFDTEEWLTEAQFERKYNRVSGYYINHLNRGWDIDAIVHDARETSKDIRHVRGQYYCNGFIELIPHIKENHLPNSEKYKLALKARSKSTNQ